MDDSEKKKGNVKAIPVRTTDLGVMLFQKAIKGHYPEALFSIRVGNEEYFACNLPFAIPDGSSVISLDDLMDFISGETAWENLKGRSYLHERKLAKEKSAQEKCAEMSAKLMKRGIQIIEAKQEGWAKQEKLEKEIQNVNDKLRKVPLWIRKIFSAE